MHRRPTYRYLSLFVVIILAAGTLLAATRNAQAATSVTFAPDADTYSNQSAPSTNYGTSTALHADNSSVERIYLRFTVKGLSSSITSAKLKLYANTASPTGISAKILSNNTWSETGLTYSNAPAAGSVISSSQPFSKGTWVTLDVSSYVKTQATYSFVVTTSSSTNVNFSSREGVGYDPQLVVTTGSTSPAPTPTSPTGDWQPSFPIRATFYYPWFPEAWNQLGIYPYTNYTPKLGFYSNYDQSTLKTHIDMMQYAKIQAAIASWWGQGSQEDSKIAGLLQASAGTNFRWALYYENESIGNPTVSQIHSDLVYIHDHYGTNPNFLRVNGKFVVFVYTDGSDGCGMADRWKQANTVGAYVVLKVFPGYLSCASQPNSWHQYSPAVAEDSQAPLSFSISPGFWLKGHSVRLSRDITRFKQNVRDMVASGAKWQLVTTFSEWGEGTAVEPATQWASSSGYGLYLDALHTDGK